MKRAYAGVKRVDVMFEKFPKKRRELPEQFIEIYAEHYKKNREGQTTASSMAQKMEAWLHRKVAADVGVDSHQSTLEIGAGTLNQLKYENGHAYDIIEPYKELYQDAEHLSKINSIYSDISEVGAERKYDRITSIATFEHILNLPEVVAHCCLLMKEQGALRVSIPNEGTFLWQLAWKLTTGLEFRLKYGLDYGVLMSYEHVNTAREIDQVLNYFFAEARCSCFGLSKGIALYRFYECKGPDVAAAKQYLHAHVSTT